MHKDCIIAISREYGSGGRDVGRLLAVDLGIPIFDKEILHMATEKSGMPEDFIEKHSESVQSKFMSTLYRMSLNVPSARVPSGYNSQVAATISNPNNKQSHADRLFLAQKSIIEEIAETGSSVIVGRCASYILRGNPTLLSVFIRGNINDRVKRAVETYKLDGKKALAGVKKIDKHRANYYELYTRRKWGAVENYDLVINTSYSGIHGAVAIIKAAIANQV